MADDLGQQATWQQLMAQRLLIVAHAPTPANVALIFGDPGKPQLGEVRRLNGRVQSWLSGPEEACTATAVRLGGQPEALPDLGECGFGAWSGRALVDVVAEDPSAVESWLHDPYAAPHGGESLAKLITRVGAVLDDHPWPDGRSVAVVTPLVARAAAVHALGAPAELIFRLDIGPLGRLLISRSDQTWRLQELRASVNRAPPC
jgi:broad specificity phosphatase PhoE